MLPLAVVIVLLGGWEAAVRGGLVDPLIVPAPTDIAQALVDDRGDLLRAAAITAEEAVLGLVVAALVGALIAVLMHLWRPARDALYPLAVGSQALPIVVLSAPLLMLFGLGVAVKVVIVALVCFFPVTVNLFDGLRAVDADQRKLLRSLHASRWQLFTLLEARAALPQAFTGLRIAAAVSVIGAVFGEWTASEDGLGHVALISYNQLDPARTFAATFLLFALSLVLYGAFAAVERRVSH